MPLHLCLVVNGLPVDRGIYGMACGSACGLFLRWSDYVPSIPCVLHSQGCAKGNGWSAESPQTDNFVIPYLTYLLYLCCFLPMYSRKPQHQTMTYGIGAETRRKFTHMNLVSSSLFSQWLRFSPFFPGQYALSLYLASSVRWGN